MNGFFKILLTIIVRDLQFRNFLNYKYFNEFLKLEETNIGFVGCLSGFYKYFGFVILLFFLTRDSLILPYVLSDPCQFAIKKLLHVSICNVEMLL